MNQYKRKEKLVNSLKNRRFSDQIQHLNFQEEIVRLMNNNIQAIINKSIHQLINLLKETTKKSKVQIRINKMIANQNLTRINSYAPNAMGTMNLI